MAGTRKKQTTREDRTTSLQSVDLGPPTGLPTGYADLLADVNQRIATARVKAALAVNRDLIELYWDIGGLIVERQAREGWGTSVIKRLGGDIQAAFPGITGFSPSNLGRMRSFYLAYQQGLTISAQAVRNLPPHDDSGAKTTNSPISAQAVRKLHQMGGARAAEEHKAIVPQPVRQLVNRSARSSQKAARTVLQQAVAESLPQAVTEIPWGHNIVLLEKLSDNSERLWYAQKTTELGWSRAVLVHQIESGLYRRQGRAITNFERTLPAPQSDLARQLLKDPYTFDFLGLADDVRERELEQGLIGQIQRFILELGKGFAFVGRQYPLEVGGETFYLDLLFYHLHLRCFVVIDLKVQPFQPEFVGKLNFYSTAVDNLLRHATDQPTIALLLCKERNRLIVEYSLQDSARPLGVATVRLLPEEIKANLPSPEEFEAQLATFDAPSPPDERTERPKAKTKRRPKTER